MRGGPCVSDATCSGAFMRGGPCVSDATCSGAFVRGGSRVPDPACSGALMRGGPCVPAAPPACSGALLMPAACLSSPCARPASRRRVCLRNNGVWRRRGAQRAGVVSELALDGLRRRGHEGRGGLRHGELPMTGAGAGAPQARSHVATTLHRYPLCAGLSAPRMHAPTRKLPLTRHPPTPRAQQLVPMVMPLPATCFNSTWRRAFGRDHVECNLMVSGGVRWGARAACVCAR